MEISPKSMKKGKVEGFALEGEAYYNPRTNTLTLNNVTANEGIVFSEPGTIELVGENSILALRNTQHAYINPNGDPITIKGEGELCILHNVMVHRLLVKDCTLHLKCLFTFSGIGRLRVERANVIIPLPILLSDIKKDIDLQECRIVYNTRGYGTYSIDYDAHSIDYNTTDIVIIQKDR